MDSAVWGVIGVLAGVVITGVVTLRAEIIRADRAETLDRWKRQDDRRLGRDDFQRTTMIDLQQAIKELIELEVRWSTSQLKGSAAVELANRHGVVCWQIVTLGWRVADQGTRESVHQLAIAGGEFGKARDASARDAAEGRVNSLAGEVLARTGALIIAFFEYPLSEKV